jgi:hypothetical protein
MVSTRKYYFKTKTAVKKLKNILNHWSDNGKRPLVFYKYIVYKINDVLKVSGILQFSKRFSLKTLMQCFQDPGARIEMDVLRPVQKPLILALMRVWVLANFHNVIEHFEAGMFCFGGRQRSMGKTMRPYIRALASYKNYNKFNFTTKIWLVQNKFVNSKRCCTRQKILFKNCSLELVSQMPLSYGRAHIHFLATCKVQDI